MGFVGGEVGGALHRQRMSPGNTVWGGGEEKPSVAEVRLGSKPLLTFWGPAALGGGCRAWALQNQMALRMLILELPGKSGTQEPVRRLLPEKDQA